MALGTITASQAGGRSASRPLTFDRLSFAADDAAPAGGTTEFEATVRTALGRTVELLSASGYGYTAGDVTHFVTYDQANDTLEYYLLSDGSEATGDLSSVSVVLDCISQ